LNAAPREVAARCSLAIVALDPERKELATAVAAGSIAVGSRCPHLVVGQAALTSQGFTNPRLGPLAIDLLRLGLSADEVLQALRQHDRWIDYRQIAIVTSDGQAVAFTGKANVGWADHIIGKYVVCLANGLVDATPLRAMLDRFEGGAGMPFTARLLDALEAGRTAACGSHGLLSAALRSGSQLRRAPLDLRVDVAGEGGDALGQLRSLHTQFEPIAEFYERWPDDPELAHGNWREWAGSHPSHSPGRTGDQ
jgi:uncharacterized Ntn-hydrolase superfamily protein